MVTAADVLWMAETIYMYIPAYLANAAPVLCGGGRALDGGRTWRGHPIFGSHKTVRGTLSGIIVGTTVGIIQLEPVKGLLMAVGAICGDLIVSFVKRRLDLRPGASFPVADQLSFIVAALTLASLVPPQPTWDRMVAIIVATIPIHLLTNIFAWLLNLKGNPW